MSNREKSNIAISLLKNRQFDSIKIIFCVHHFYFGRRYKMLYQSDVFYDLEEENLDSTYIIMPVIITFLLELL